MWSPAVRTRVDIGTHGQHPWGIIVACSDSRVAPEIVFDAGLGDLFVIRCAGHYVDTSALASIEYAVHHLKSKCIVVVGHEKCGAVAAAVQHHATDPRAAVDEGT